MKNLKNKTITVAIILITMLLAGVAIFTAVRLYQLRQSSVSPLNPQSEPEAYTTQICKLSFNITLATATATPTPTPTKTPKPTPTKTPKPTPTKSPKPTPVSRCDESCGVSSDCASGLICYGASIAQTGKCRKASCPKQ